MNTKKFFGDDQILQPNAAPEDATELNTEQMEEITGGVKTTSWSGSDADTPS